MYAFPIFQKKDVMRISPHFVFGLFGVVWFGGTFWYCADPATGARLSVEETPEVAVCGAKGYDWRNVEPNFDDLLMSFLALFQVMLIDGWSPVMHSAMDARGIGLQPKAERVYLPIVFFISTFLSAPM